MHDRLKSERSVSFLLIVTFCLVALSACNPISPTNVIPTATPTPFYFLAGGGSCVQLGNHPLLPAVNMRVSHDVYLAHSEPMLAEDPQNPLHLVGGSKFFTDLAHYRFQIGTYTSFDAGCTWTDGGVLPGFASSTLTSED